MSKPYLVYRFYRSQLQHMRTQVGNQLDAPLFRREMRERWRRPLTYLLLIAYAGMLACLAYTFYTTLIPQNSVDVNQLLGIGRPYFQSLSCVQIVLSLPLGILLAAPAVATERERNSLTDFLLAGITPRDIIFAKFASVGTFVSVLALLPFPILALCFPLGGISPGEFFAVFALSLAAAVASASIGLNISVASKQVTTALLHGLMIAVGLSCVVGPPLYALIIVPWPLVLLISGFIGVLSPVVALDSAIYSLEYVTHRLGDDERIFAAPISSSTQHSASPVFAPPLDVAPKPITATATAPQPSLHVITPKRMDGAESAPTEFERALEHLAVCNPITEREVRTQFRLWRLGKLASNPQSRLRDEFNLSLVMGVTCAIFSWTLGVVTLWRVCWWFALLGAMAMIAVQAAGAFTREREQKMLSTVQMTALSSREIVTGKIMASLLVTARWLFWPLWVLWLTSWCEGIQVAFGTAVLTVAALVLASTFTIMLSLLCRHTAVVASGALVSVFGLFLVSPIFSYQAKVFGLVESSTLIERVWAEPIQLFLGFGVSTLSVGIGLSLLAVCCFAAILLAGLFTIWRLSRMRVEEEHRSVWQRDLSRNWQ